MCKNDNFSFLKTKPYRSKRCKVLTNQYADKKRERQPPLSFFLQERDRTHLNAMLRWSIAATSSKTGGFYYFLPQWQKMKIDPGHRHQEKREAVASLFFCRCGIEPSHRRQSNIIRTGFQTERASTRFSAFAFTAIRLIRFFSLVQSKMLTGSLFTV